MEASSHSVRKLNELSPKRSERIVFKWIWPRYGFSEAFYSLSASLNPESCPEPDGERARRVACWILEPASPRTAAATELVDYMRYRRDQFERNNEVVAV